MYNHMFVQLVYTVIDIDVSSIESIERVRTKHATRFARHQPANLTIKSMRAERGSMRPIVRTSRPNSSTTAVNGRLQLLDVHTPTYPVFRQRQDDLSVRCR